MSLNNLRHISKFIAKLVDCNYINTDLATLLRDMDMDMDIDETVTNNLVRLATTYDSATRLSAVHNIGAARAITICDELCASSTIDKLLALTITLPILSDNQIINHHTYALPKILRAYGQGYRIIPCYDNIDYDHNYMDNYASVLHTAIDNELYLSNIKIGQGIAKCNDRQIKNLREIRRLYLLKINDEIIDTLSHCNNVEKLWIMPNGSTDTSNLFEVFESCKCIRNLKKLYVNFPIDKYLKFFPHLEEFDASYCSGITTFGPCAKHLKILHANHNIDDNSIVLCTNLRELDAHNNSAITTCRPFAKTLKILFASGTCGISDDGLLHCTRIRQLYANNNCNITTCKSFAKHLKILDASCASGITDDGLELCGHIRELRADNNVKITTCEPFASHLKVLRACNICGISDNGLKSCIRITQLHANDNEKITTCEPFARTLQILYAEDACGISDDGLKSCTRITTLHVSNNKRITTCVPFATHLKVLDACTSAFDQYIRIIRYSDRPVISFIKREQCGITDDSLKLCTMLEELHVENNKYVTTCAPFADHLKILSATEQCGISDDGLKLCTSIHTLKVGTNTRITTCAPFVHALTSATVDLSNKPLIDELKLYTHVNVR